jgi:hypothetical protein
MPVLPRHANCWFSSNHARLPEMARTPTRMPLSYLAAATSIEYCCPGPLGEWRCHASDESFGRQKKNPYWARNRRHNRCARTSQTGRTSCSAADGNLPSAQEKMLPAKTASIRLEQPMKGPLHGVPGVYPPKIDRLTVGTLRSEQSHCGSNHHFDSPVAIPSAVGAGCRIDGEV